MGDNDGTRPGRVELCELGQLGVRVDGRWFPLRGERAAALAAGLSLALPRHVPTPQLIEDMWPSPDAPAHARQSLANIVLRLRRAFGNDFIESTGDGYRLGSGVVSERREFNTAVSRAGEAVTAATALDRTDAALALWRGDPWLGIEHPDAVAGDRASLLARHRVAREYRAGALIALGRGIEALFDLAQLSIEDPGNEQIVRKHMLALEQAGKRGEALDVLARARRALGERGLDPGGELVVLESDLLDGGVVRVDRSSRIVPLPDLRTSTIGRDAEIAAVVALADEHSVITITGPPGVGKTRLAIAAARRLPRSAVFVDLTSVRSTAHCDAAIARSLGLRDDGLVPPGEAALRALSDTPRLLVLDNCEHVTDAVRRFVEMVVGTCPGTSVVATSREPLSATGERVLPLEALPTGPNDAGVQLFLERASERGVVLDRPAVVTDVAAICAAIDGLPLAIELAASRSTVLAPREMLEALDDRFDLLRASTETGRHSSLFDTIAWSWDQLDAADRHLLVQLAVFAAPVTVGDIADVLDASMPTVLEQVEGLALKSLIVVRREDPVVTRITLLESIREFALDRGRDEDVYRAVADAHLRWVDRRTHAAIGDLGESAQRRSDLGLLDLIAPEVHAALGRAAGGEAGTGLRIVTRLFNWWRGRGIAAEGVAYFESLDKPGIGTLPIRVHATATAATLARIAGRPMADVERLCRRTRETMAAMEAVPLRERIELHLLEAEFDLADMTLESRLLRLVEDCSLDADPNSVAVALHLLAAWSIVNAPQLAAERAEWQRIVSEDANAACQAHAAEQVGLAALACNQPKSSVDHLLDALDQCEEMGQRFCSVHCCESIGWFLARRGRRDDARRVMAAAEGVRRIAGRPRAGFEQPAIVGAMAALGDLPEPNLDATVDSLIDLTRRVVAHTLRRV